MKPHTVLLYDSALNYTVVQGGELTAEEISAAPYIADYPSSTSEELIASPNIKVEYDLHGFIQNIYYPTPGRPGQYQLSNPIRTRTSSDSKIIDPGETFIYDDVYRNYDTGLYEHCTLTRSADGSMIAGTGRITFYTGTYGDSGDRLLIAYDCATKMGKDDVKRNTVVFAKNTKKINGKITKNTMLEECQLQFLIFGQIQL